MFLDWKNQYCENVYTTQSNLQIQCNPYQITNGIFLKNQKKNLKICMETQKTLISNYTIKLQQSKRYGTVTKTDTQINGIEQTAQK